MNEETNGKKKGSAGRKACLIIGIILLNISIFLGSFVLAFNVIINPDAQYDQQIEELNQKNRDLQDQNMLLQGQLEMVQAENDAYRERYGDSSDDESGSGRSRASSSPSRSSSDDEE